MLSTPVRSVLQWVSLLVWVAGSIVVLELSSRLLHLGTRPVVPSIQDELGHYRMVPAFSSSIRLPGGRSYRICTDRFGLRLSCETVDREAVASTLVVGDSQASGWGLSWEDSIGGRLEAASGHLTKTLATAANDIETLRFWFDDYWRSQPTPPRRVIFVFNMGNDLDELILSRAFVVVPVLRQVKNWLAAHSFLFLDVNLLKYLLTGGDFSFPPGANPVVMMLDRSEREVLSVAAANIVAQMRDRCCATMGEFEVLLLPNDYQVHPEEFAKYRPFYHSVAEYQKWEDNVPVAKLRLDEIAVRLVVELQKHHIAVTRADEALAPLPGALAFDRGSHHLTAAGVHAVIDRLQRNVSSGTPTNAP